MSKNNHINSRKCKNCGSDTTNKTFCSRECVRMWNAQHQKKQENFKNCDVCGSEIYVQPFKQKHQKNFFCSRECQHNWQSINWSKDGSPNSTGKYVFCPICQKSIYVNNYTLEHNTNIYCSKKCGNILKSKLQIGENNPNFGNKWTDEQKTIARKRTINQYKNGKFIQQDTKPERMVENWLLFNNINYIKQVPYKYGIMDFWLPELDCVVEVYGDYWHNLPDYKIRDERKNTYLNENFSNVCICWEHEIKNNVERCLASIQ